MLRINLIEVQADLKHKTEELDEVNAAENKEDLNQTNSRIQMIKVG